MLDSWNTVIEDKHAGTAYKHRTIVCSTLNRSSCIQLSLVFTHNRLISTWMLDSRLLFMIVCSSCSRALLL